MIQNMMGVGIVMKKLTFILLLSVLLTGCSNTNNPNISEKDLFIIDQDSNKKIGLGMKKSEIENILGLSTNTSNNWYVYDGIHIAFRNDKVVGLRLLDDSNGRYLTTRKVGVGSPKNKLLEAYGDFLIGNTLQEQYIDIYIEYTKDGRYKVLDKDDRINHENEDNIYIISFIMDIDEVIKSVWIIDYLFGTRFQ